MSPEVPGGPTVPRARRRPRVIPHPTATLLLETAEALLDVFPIEGLTIHLILERSGVSYGSLYHHYEDISDLVEQAIVQRFSRRVKQQVDQIRTLLDSQNKTEFRERTEAMLAESLRPDRASARRERVEALGAIKGRPRLEARLARVQQELTNRVTDTMRVAQQREWMRTDLDAESQAVFLQSVMIGRIIDDVSEHPIGDERWSSVALPALRSILLSD